MKLLSIVSLLAVIFLGSLAFQAAIGGDLGSGDTPGRIPGQHPFGYQRSCHRRIGRAKAPSPIRDEGPHPRTGFRTSSQSFGTALSLCRASSRGMSSESETLPLAEHQLFAQRHHEKHPSCRHRTGTGSEDAPPLQAGLPELAICTRGRPPAMRSKNG